MKGYTGKILNVDLSKGLIDEETIDDTVYEKFLSGVGLAAHLLYERIPKGADPLGPDNILGLVAGMLCGTGTYFSGRWMAVGKSPLTGGWGDASGGGSFGPALKRAGYDGIFFKGISKKPVYLHIDNKGAELKNASGLWGMDTVEAEEKLIKETQSKITPSVAVIGQAGENLSRISGISNEKGRIAARSGLGAVMGSKKLKAVIIASAGKVGIRNRDKLKALQLDHDKFIKTAPNVPIPGWSLRLIGKLMGKAKDVSPADGIYAYSFLKKWGTGSNNRMGIETGDSPVKNWKGSNLDFTKKQSKQHDPGRIKKLEFEKYHCPTCPIGCGGKVTTKDRFKEVHKPEYETIAQLGTLLLVEDLDSVLYMMELCNRAGMDLISAGGTLAFALECYEEGILTNDDTDGLELTWGNSEALIALLEKMITRQGIGDILADGVKVAAQKIGQGSEAYAIHAGGQELPAHDPRHDPNFGIHYSVDPTPGRHTIGSQGDYSFYRIWEVIKSFPKLEKMPVAEKYTVKDKGAMAAGDSILKMLTDSAGLCYFGPYGGMARFPMAEFFNAVADWNKTPEEYFDIGRRIQTLRHLFNIKHGIDPWSPKAHPRSYGSPPLNDGVLKGKTFDLDAMIKDYWKTMGWDSETGIPAEETLKKLGLDNLFSEVPSDGLHHN